MDQQPIQLGLGVRLAHAPPVIRLADRLLGILADAVPHVESLDTDGFRGRVADLRRRLEADEALDGPAVDRWLAECEAFSREARDYLASREDELLEIIDLLREAVTTLSGGSIRFHEDFASSAARLRELGNLGDLRALKRALIWEVEHLERVVGEQRRLEEAEIAGLMDRVEQLESRLADNAAARPDAVPGVATHEVFARTLTRWFDPQRGAARPFSVALVDVPGFPGLVEQHGASVGQRVLACVGQLLAGGLERDEVAAHVDAARFGLLLEADGEAAQARLQSVRRRLAPAYRYGAAGEMVRFDLACGIAQREPGDSRQAVLDRASRALDAARAGSDRVVFKRPFVLRRLFGRSPAGAA